MEIWEVSRYIDPICHNAFYVKVDVKLIKTYGLADAFNLKNSLTTSSSFLKILEISKIWQTNGTCIELYFAPSETPILSCFLMIGIPDEPARKKGRKIRLTFNEEEMVINPEDVDPSIGR